jgi:hypothetical protein
MQAESSVPQSQNSVVVTPAVTPILSFPTMSREEFLDLEREAGHPFLSDEQAHLYRLSNIFRLSVERMLADREAA